MKQRISALGIVLTAVILLTSSIFAGELSVGAVGSVFVAPYKSYNTTILPLPAITYKSDRLYLRGTSLGVHLFKNEKHEVSLGASYLGLEFKPRKTDEQPLRQLDKRRSTLLADLSYSYVSRIGLIRAQLAQDVLGHSDGMLGNLSLHVPWITDSFVIMPGAGIQWASAKHNKYYYGVSDREAARSGVRRYNPGQTVSPYVTLEAKVRITDCWDFIAKGRVEYMTGRIKNSPMVGKSFTTAAMAGIQYNF